MLMKSLEQQNQCHIYYENLLFNKDLMSSYSGWQAGICTEIIYIASTADRRIWHSAWRKVHSCADRIQLAMVS